MRGGIQWKTNTGNIFQFLGDETGIGVPSSSV